MHKEIEKELEKLKKLKKELYGFQHAAECAEKAIEGQEDCSIGCGIQQGQLKGILIHMNEMKTLQDIEPVIRMLSIMDYPLKTPKVSTWPEVGRTTWDCGDIKIIGFMSSDKAVCKWVEVGKKEEPVYELRCQETEDLDPTKEML